MSGYTNDGVGPGLLDPESAIPLYYQLFLRLRDDLTRQVYKPGELLPSESELERIYEVSRVTVRRAIDELKQRGLVSREKGRGTRVLPVHHPRPPILGSVDELLETNRAMGRETEASLIECDYIAAPDHVAEALSIPAGSIVQHAVRIRSSEGFPFSHLTTFVPEAFGRLYSSDDLTTTPLVTLLERQGIAISFARQTISAENASRRTAQHLRLQTGQALLRVERTVYAEGDLPIEHLIALYRPDLHAYQMILGKNGARDLNM